MTASQLLLYITTALLLQLAVAIGVAVWQRRGMPAATAPTGGEPSDAGTAQAGSIWREFRVMQREFEDPARSQCSFYLAPVDGAPLPPFKPGQFLTFSLQVGDASAAASGGTRAITRCYSLSDAPDPAHHRVTIKRVAAPPDHSEWAPGLSSNHFHDRVQVGDVLKVKAPSGHFFIDADAGVPAVLIGGGIGITPMMSMLRWCLAEQPQRDVHLFYGLRNSDEHAFKAALEQLAQNHPRLHLNVVYSRPGPNDVVGRDYQHHGRVDVELLRRTLPHGRHGFYVCGPPALMESLVPALVTWGVPRQDIHFEAFGPASVRLGDEPVGTAEPGLDAPVEVAFRRSGRTLVWDGVDTSLLDFAERHGLIVEAGCRSGGCGSCETPLLTGSVRYARQPDHDVKPGHCLLCVGTPGSALVLEA